MANKIGLNYYRVDTDRYLDIRIKRLKKDYGCRGLAVYDYVLCEVYRDKGCFLEWDESTAFDVAEYLGLKESVVQEIVKYCSAVGLFDKEMLRCGIITSASIQRRYLEMCTRAKRKDIRIPKICRLEDGRLPEESPQIPEAGAEIPEFEGEFPENSGSSSQSKVKKNKVNTPPIIPPKGEKGADDSDSANPEKGKKKSCAKRKSLDLTFVEPALRPAMTDWLSYKSERGQTYRQTGAEKCYRQLSTFSEGDPQKAQQIVDRSIANNWAGLFPLREQEGKARAPSRLPATDYDNNRQFKEF